MKEPAIVIPARLASTRLPRKVLRDLLGKPLIQWVYEGCLDFNNHVWVATPDDEIVDAVAKFGGMSIKTEPTDTVLDRCSLAASILADRHYDSIIVVQGDEPMVRAGMLWQVAGANPVHSIVQLIKPLAADEDPWNPNIPKVVIDNDEYILYASRCPVPGATPEKDHTFNAIYYKQVCVMRFDIDTLINFRWMPRGPVESAEGIDILRYLENGGPPIKALFSLFNTKAVDTAEDLNEVRRLLTHMGET